MSDADVQDSLSWDNLIYITDFLEGSGENHISLLGGEPLLHPQIAEFILYLNKRGFSTTVFTSGIMPSNKFDEFAKALLSCKNDLNVGFVCNVNDPKLSKKSELEKVHRFLSIFGGRCSLSFNIYRLDFDMDFLIDYIVDYSLNRHIRLGLAHPIPGANNLYIKPKDFHVVKDVLLKSFSKMAEMEVVPGFDCGFPLCMFNNEELGLIYKYTHGQVSFQCGPAIDIGTDMSCWSCFPLSNFHKKSIFDFSSSEELHEFYRVKMQEIRNEVRGIYQDCDTCDNYKHNLCSGGCLAHILSNYITEGGIR
jgi:radical SAM protein with 4Fe4S-binding SPASM domain